MIHFRYRVTRDVIAAISAKAPARRGVSRCRVPFTCLCVPFWPRRPLRGVRAEQLMAMNTSPVKEIAAGCASGGTAGTVATSCRRRGEMPLPLPPRALTAADMSM